MLHFAGKGVPVLPVHDSFMSLPSINRNWSWE